MVPSSVSVSVETLLSKYHKQNTHALTHTHTHLKLNNLAECIINCHFFSKLFCTFGSSFSN